MPRLENLRPLQTLNPLGGKKVDPANKPGEDKDIPVPITGTQAETQDVRKHLHRHEIKMYVDKDSWISIYISKWVKAYFNVADTTSGNYTPENNFYAKQRKNIGSKDDKPAARKDGGGKTRPRAMRGMRLIHLPLKDDESAIKGEDLANHPTAKRKNGIAYLTMRVPLVANFDSIAVLIKDQFKANTPKRFYTEKGTSVTIPDSITKADLGTHPGLVKGVQTGTK